MNKFVRVATECMCGSVDFIQVSADGYANWRERGSLIQDALPQLSASERERLMTGTCQKCWEEMWADE